MGKDAHRQGRKLNLGLSFLGNAQLLSICLYPLVQVRGRAAVQCHVLSGWQVLILLSCLYCDWTGQGHEAHAQHLLLPGLSHTHMHYPNLWYLQNEVWLCDASDTCEHWERCSIAGELWTSRSSGTLLLLSVVISQTPPTLFKPHAQQFCGTLPQWGWMDGWIDAILRQGP